MILKTMDKATIYVKEETAKEIAKSIQDGNKIIVVDGNFINVSSISGIYKQEALKIETLEGRLHDGVKVVKKFGKWIDPYNPDITFDLRYYPELAKDEVMTEEEWQEKETKKLLN